MQCHGGMVPLGIGADRPIFTIGSGPVGGLIGCARVCKELGTGDVIASDMGGTSFDVGIIKDGEPLAADDTLLGKFRYRIPALEVISIGAGGGSIAWIDRHGGGLRVGPESASSLPRHGDLFARQRPGALVAGQDRVEPLAARGMGENHRGPFGRVKPPLRPLQGAGQHSEERPALTRQ